MSRHCFSFHLALGAGPLIAAGLLAITGCSGDGQPPGEVIEIETIEIIEPDAPVKPEPAATPSPPPPEPSADAST